MVSYNFYLAGVPLVALILGFLIGLITPVIRGEFHLGKIYKTDYPGTIIWAVVFSTLFLSWMNWQYAGDFLMTFENILIDFWPAMIVAPIIGVLVGRGTKFWHILN
ncbi:hypothetical protein LCGC14_0302990 [marine sediment metagenome]|uniref:Uncharacterized protein n=1 Tax=marine sediment metagenome TaxID=412755 RepID=A0A0F9WVR3_9ZZZZ